MLKLYEFRWEVLRGGDITGLFIEDEEVVQNYIGSQVYFGEICGKHSEVSGTLDEGDLRVISDDQEKIEWLLSILGRSVSGYNPFDYIEMYYEDDEDLEEEA